MKPKELAERTGVKERTIRFYEEQGLLSPKLERKNGRNYREYSEDDVERLSIIAALRRARFTIEEIRALLGEGSGFAKIYPSYYDRIQSQAEASARLMRTIKAIDPTEMDLAALIAHLETYSLTLDLPTIDSAPNFGQFDQETTEEKQQAIEAYYVRQDLSKLLKKFFWIRRRNLMKLFKKSDNKQKKPDNQEKNLRQGVYSATAVEHTYVKGGVRDGGLGNAQKLAVMQMLRDEDK